MSLVGQKSLLAKLMATENLIIRQLNVPTASFDVLNRVLTVPILDRSLSKDLYDLFMGHEVGHALYTPVEGMRKARDDGVNMSVLNVVEDSRIERKIKTKYPGIRTPFVKAYGELYERNFFETEGKDINQYNLVDRINLHCKIGASLALPFTDEEREILRKVETTETYDDVIEVAKLICDRMVDEMEGMEEIQVLIQVAADDDSTEEDEKDDNSDDSEENSRQEQKSNKGKSKKDDKEQEKEETLSDDNNITSSEQTQKPQEQEKDSSDKSSTGASRNQKQKDIRSHTDEAYRKNEEQLFSKEDQRYVYANVPSYDTNRIMDFKVVYTKYKDGGYDVPLDNFNAYRRESSKVVSYLVKEFELRKNADQMKRATTAKTGELNMNRIYAYNFTDDIFKKMTVMPDGKSHGLVMFLDWSGSMARHIGNTVKQLLNLAIFCKKVNIPFEVYSFVESTDGEYMYAPAPKNGDLAMNKFGLLNLLSSRMNASEFSFAGAALMKIAGLTNTQYTKYRPIYTPHFMAMNGTPLNESIIAAMEIVPQFQKKYNLQIVNTVFLTDGEGSILNQVYGEYSAKYTHMHIRDPKTRHEEIFDKEGAIYASMAQTDCLIRLLKQRTNSHVIGFFVCDSKDISSRMYAFFPDISKIEKAEERNERVDKIKSQFKTNSYCVVTSTGFDDYYLLRSSGLDTEDEEELTFKDNATTRGMANAFSKYASKKINTRVVLNRFIDLIA